MKKTDAQLDTLALQVENIEQELFIDEGQELEVHDLLKSVSEVKDNYQNLRKDLLEVGFSSKSLGQVEFPVIVGAGSSKTAELLLKSPAKNDAEQI